MREAEDIARTRERHEKKALFLLTVFVLFAASQHSYGGRAGLPLPARRECPSIQAGQIHRSEFQSLTGVNCEKPDCVEVHSPRRKLPKLSVLAEDFQAPHILKECMFRISTALEHFQSLFVGKLEKLKNGQSPLLS